MYEILSIFSAFFLCMNRTSQPQFLVLCWDHSSTRAPLRGCQCADSGCFLDHEEEGSMAKRTRNVIWFMKRRSIIRAIGTRCILETRAIHSAKSLQRGAISPFPLLAAAYTRATGESCWFVMLLSHIPHHTAHTASNLCDTMGDNNIAQNAESRLPQVVSPAPCGDRRSLTIAQ